MSVVGVDVDILLFSIGLYAQVICWKYDAMPCAQVWCDGDGFGCLRAQQSNVICDMT